MRTCNMQIQQTKENNKELQGLLNRKEAAKYLGVSVAFLERAAWAGEPKIPYIHVGKRAVRYALTDLDSYIKTNTKTFMEE